MYPYKVRKMTKIRNQYNHIPHLTQDTTCPLPSFGGGGVALIDMEFKDQHKVIQHLCEGQTKIQGAKQLYSQYTYILILRIIKISELCQDVKT